MNISETREYSDLIETREFIREHRVRHVNEISAPAWRFLDRAQKHIDQQITDMTATAFYAPDEPSYSTAGLDPQFSGGPDAH